LNLLKTVLTYAALFSVGAVTSVACFDPDLPNPSFRCSPATAAANGDSGCPNDEFCCSDDPATVGGKIPNYYMDGVNDAKYGTPLFSDLNNSLSNQGMCVELGGFASPLVTGCPVPCNPKWDAAKISEICGAAQCCQTEELDAAKDCIMGQDGRWRAANGSDIIAGRSTWGPAHTSNQDPNAAGCKVFAGGSSGPAYLDCITQLSTADQRGFCYSLGCPCIEDVCDMKNADFKPRCGTGA